MRMCAFRPAVVCVRIRFANTWTQGDINTREMLFVTMAGLRGSASLIMGSAVVTQQFAEVSGSPETFSVGAVLAGSTRMLWCSCLLAAVAEQYGTERRVSPTANPVRRRHARPERTAAVSTAQHGTAGRCQLSRLRADVPLLCTRPQVVKAMMVFWTAGFVLMTLGINAPMLPFVLRVLGLSKVGRGVLHCVRLCAGIRSALL